MWWQEITEWTPTSYRQLDLEVAQSLDWHIEVKPIEVGGNYYLLYTPSGERVSGSLKSAEHALELGIAAGNVPSFSQDLNVTLPLMRQLPEHERQAAYDAFMKTGDVHVFALAWLAWVNHLIE